MYTEIEKGRLGLYPEVHPDEATKEIILEIFNKYISLDLAHYWWVGIPSEEGGEILHTCVWRNGEYYTEDFLDRARDAARGAAEAHRSRTRNTWKGEFFLLEGEWSPHIKHVALYYDYLKL